MIAGLFLVGCVTEPAPPDTTQFGHISPPKKARKQKAPKPPKVTTEESTTTVIP